MESRKSEASIKRNPASSLSRRLFDAESSAHTLSPVRPIQNISTQSRDALRALDAQKQKVKNSKNLDSNLDACANTRANNSNGSVVSDCDTNYPAKANSSGAANISEYLTRRVAELEELNNNLVHENRKLKSCISTITTQYNSLYTSLHQAQISVRHLKAQNSALSQKLSFSDQKLDQYISTAFVQRTTIADLEAANDALIHQNAAQLNALKIADLSKSIKTGLDAQLSCAMRKHDLSTIDITPERRSKMKFKNAKCSISDGLERANASCNLFRESQENPRSKQLHTSTQQSAERFLFVETDKEILPHLCGF